MKSMEYFKVSLIFFILVSLIPVSVFGYSNSPTVSIWTDKTTYCIGDSITVYYKVSYGTNTTAYVDIIDYSTGGKTVYLRNNTKINTNTTYYFKSTVGGPTGTEKLKIVGKTSSSSSSSATCSFKINNCSSNNNTNITNKSSTPTNNTDKYSSRFSSTDDVLRTIRNSDSSIKSVSLGQIDSGYDFLTTFNFISPATGAVGYIYKFASCMNGSGVYDGIFYASTKNGYTSCGSLIIVDKKEATDPWNWIWCSFKTISPMDITDKETVRVKLYKIEIDNRFIAYYASYNWSGNNVESNILKALGGKVVDYRVQDVPKMGILD
ncbi:MAG: hypothetical protein AMQ22_00106 [Candidatus Methanofastidiosum methylothiophilum]|uniref:Uncharacterized protein n=1 Tax=Candidatus Methanofastidiosum methylothiophilum TaxID=1705564 RepID=A0A150J947_9EURY|nr:MAG: hypothetical protein AMQ22_00106 [Candidatus Methanofastidiosum methylthiophilus]